MIGKQIRQDEQTHHSAPFNQVNSLIRYQNKTLVWADRYLHLSPLSF